VVSQSSHSPDPRRQKREKILVRRSSPAPVLAAHAWVWRDPRVWRLWAVDDNFGQWTVTLGWMATLGWTATSGWPETGWSATLGNEGEGWRQESSPETNVGRVDLFDFWK
jgi:hypothetical protein